MRETTCRGSEIGSSDLQSTLKTHIRVNRKEFILMQIMHYIRPHIRKVLRKHRLSELHSPMLSQLSAEEPVPGLRASHSQSECSLGVLLAPRDPLCTPCHVISLWTQAGIQVWTSRTSPLDTPFLNLFPRSSDKSINVWNNTCSFSGP